MDSYNRHRRRRRRSRGRRRTSRSRSPPAPEANPDQAGDQADPAAGFDNKKADVKHSFENIYISKNQMRLSVDDIVPQTYAAMTPRGLHVIPSHHRSHVATFDPVTLELKEVSRREASEATGLAPRASGSWVNCEENSVYGVKDGVSDELPLHVVFLSARLLVNSSPRSSLLFAEEFATLLASLLAPSRPPDNQTKLTPPPTRTQVSPLPTLLEKGDKLGNLCCGKYGGVMSFSVSADASALAVMSNDINTDVTSTSSAPPLPIPVFKTGLPNLYVIPDSPLPNATPRYATSLLPQL